MRRSGESTYDRNRVDNMKRNIKIEVFIPSYPVGVFLPRPPAKVEVITFSTTLEEVLPPLPTGVYYNIEKQ
jgi:hypothetical protein